MNEKEAKEARPPLPGVCEACVAFRSRPENQKGLFAWCAEHLCKWCPFPRPASEPDQPKA
jgi:hypothetical protein